MILQTQNLPWSCSDRFRLFIRSPTPRATGRRTTRRCWPTCARPSATTGPTPPSTTWRSSPTRTTIAGAAPGAPGTAGIAGTVTGIVAGGGGDKNWWRDPCKSRNLSTSDQLWMEDLLCTIFVQGSPVLLFENFSVFFSCIQSGFTLQMFTLKMTRQYF